MVLDYELELLPGVLVHRNIGDIQREWLKFIPVTVEGVKEDALCIVFHVVAEAKHKFILLIFRFVLLMLNHLAA